MKQFLSVILIFFFSSTSLYSQNIIRIKIVFFPFKEAIISSRVESVLLPYNLKIGEKFAENTVIATLDSTRFNIIMRRVTAQYEFAKSNFEDKKKLRAENITSDFEVKKSEFEYKLLENDLADAKLNLSYCTIQAPFPGKITEILTREYETARVGQPLLKIINDNKLLGIMNVPMTLKGLTTIGAPIKINLPNYKIQATGTIYEINPQADHRTETVRVTVLIDNTSGIYKAGMTGEVPILPLARKKK
ncbi:MAG: efflux RND transporter periplasmic adaptor subunit [Planctomycetes bacterium]|jgi:RND family efflux transporter MFP subunit|nr:efflux RND transporter periplasmic adaptor subunit [Planctomycetota bacterium]HON44677.1 efflux RND transporter periplasmic adaptor subunit [Planctomycetota bacterium]HPY74729.1 efflux RND transporter periplasmic adaptor subunit [Planctomycetota bacterium]HQA99736.1 efflux RND transporter periplasmic adaptor subunit [Planctomycetota bacterium]HRU51132.1 efflux RND transporter periplasmic adaptor subunit [Planctomycetota bacterium]